MILSDRNLKLSDPVLLISGSTLSGSFQYYHRDRRGNPVIESVVSHDLLKKFYLMNREIANHRGKKLPSDFMNHAATIPMSVYYDLHKRGIAQDEKEFMRWLDGDGAIFKSTEARLS